MLAMFSFTDSKRKAVEGNADLGESDVPDLFARFGVRRDSKLYLLLDERSMLELGRYGQQFEIQVVNHESGGKLAGFFSDENALRVVSMSVTGVFRKEVFVELAQHWGEDSWDTRNRQYWIRRGLVEGRDPSTILAYVKSLGL